MDVCAQEKRAVIDTTQILRWYPVGQPLAESETLNKNFVRELVKSMLTISAAMQQVLDSPENSDNTASTPIDVLTELRDAPLREDLQDCR